MQPGLVSEIQRFSLHDGPGIRTTIFLKGCPLRCFWCHNPEAWAENPGLWYCEENCLRCGKCADLCENKVHAFVDNRHILNRERCRMCGKCVNECFADALEVNGVMMTPEEVFEIIIKDKSFYTSSGGGVTLSGGEPLSQHLFCREILSQCKSSGIHCAIETSGFAQWDVIERLLPYLDLVILDIKLLDEQKHIEYTGVANTLILENTERLSRTGIDLIVRTPVVPGINNNAESIRQIYLLIESFANLRKYELMPFHMMADSKYESLGLTNPAKGLKAVTREEIDNLYKEIL